MATHASQDSVSAAEYLAAERSSSDKRELWRGEIFAMAGASYRHNRIVANLLGVLGSTLDRERCVALPSDMKVHVPSRGGFVYPDASIVCGPPGFYDQAEDVLVNPAAVFEVLSNTTERFDRGEKFVGYRSIPTLHELVLVAQHERRVEHYVRGPDGTWILHEHAGDAALTLLCGGTLELAALYRDAGVEA